MSQITNDQPHAQNAAQPRDFHAAVADVAQTVKALRLGIVERASATGSSLSIPGAVQTSPRSAVVRSSELSTHGWGAGTYLVKNQVETLLAMMSSGLPSDIRALREVLRQAESPSGKTPPQCLTHIDVAIAMAPHIKEIIALREAVLGAIAPNHEAPNSDPPDEQTRNGYARPPARRH